jgi:predicted  nucleic acid-binding Zn-ribbon protein
MSQTALDQIKAIQEKADKEIAALKAKAVSEIVQKISAAKATLAALEEEYKELTGKDLKGEKVEGKRRRLSSEEKAALIETVKTILRGHKQGVKISAIVSQTGEPVSAVRGALASIKEVKTTGSRASTLYFLK